MIVHVLHYARTLCGEDATPECPWVPRGEAVKATCPGCKAAMAELDAVDEWVVRLNARASRSKITAHDLFAFLEDVRDARGAVA